MTSPCWSLTHCGMTVWLHGAGKHKVKGLTAGLPPTTALWNLKLALAYYSSSLGNLSADLASRSSSGSLPANDDLCFGHVSVSVKYLLPRLVSHLAAAACQNKFRLKCQLCRESQSKACMLASPGVLSSPPTI